MYLTIYIYIKYIPKYISYMNLNTSDKDIWYLFEIICIMYEIKLFILSSIMYYNILCFIKYSNVNHDLKLLKYFCKNNY